MYIKKSSKAQFQKSNRAASPTPAGLEIIYLASLTSRQVLRLTNGPIKHLLITTLSRGGIPTSAILSFSQIASDSPQICLARCLLGLKGAG